MTMYEEPIPGHESFDEKQPVLIFGFEGDHAWITRADGEGKVEFVHLDTITVDWRYIDGEWHDLNEAAEGGEEEADEDDDEGP